MEYSQKDHIKRNVQSAKRKIETIHKSVFTSKEIETTSYIFSWGRKGVHLLFSVFGLFLILLPSMESITIKIMTVMTITMTILDTMRLISKEMNELVYKYLGRVFIRRDNKRYSSATFYMIGIVIVSYIFEPKIAGFGILILGFGDFSASLGGVYLKKYIPYQLPYSHKTYIGLLSFVVITSAICSFLGFNPKYVVISTLISALSEVYISFIDDNLLLPLVGSGTYYLLTLI